MRFAVYTPVVAMILMAPLTGCEEQSASSEPSASASTWLLDEAPPDAQPVGKVKAEAAEGDAVTVLGRIGGRREPISADSPVFVIVDLAVPHCGQLPDDHCPTPWDYCCEPRENLTAHTATVQLVNDAGRSLDANPVQAGLKPLDRVIIVGTVAPRPSPDVLTIRAAGVYRLPGEEQPHQTKGQSPHEPADQTHRPSEPAPKT